MNLVQKCIREEDGQDGIEYALLIGFVSVAVVASVTPFVKGFDTFWKDVSAAVSAASAAAS